MKSGLAFIGGMLSAWRGFSALCIGHHLRHRLAEAGDGVELGDHVRLHGANHIRIGADSIIGHHVTLRALTTYPWTDPPQCFTPDLRIGAGCFISNFTHISCARRITIGNQVMIADGCFISDNQHSYRETDRPIKTQPLTLTGEIHIGNGAWLGAGACVCGQVRIGQNCVVGANAVVTHDLPDFCLAVGAPARIIKRFDPATGDWRRTQPDGEFNTQDTI